MHVCVDEFKSNRSAESIARVLFRRRKQLSARPLGDFGEVRSQLEAKEAEGREFPKLVYQRAPRVE